MSNGYCTPAVSCGRHFLHTFNGKYLSFERIGVFPEENDGHNSTFHTIMQGMGIWNAIAGVHNLPNFRSLKRNMHVPFCSWSRRGRLRAFKSQCDTIDDDHVQPDAPLKSSRIIAFSAKNTERQGGIVNVGNLRA